jgi:hypothetical protein
MCPSEPSLRGVELRTEPEGGLFFNFDIFMDDRAHTYEAPAKGVSKPVGATWHVLCTSERSYGIKIMWFFDRRCCYRPCDAPVASAGFGDPPRGVMGVDFSDNKKRPTRMVCNQVV